MQSHTRALEDVQKNLEGQTLLAHQELEAATASNKALSDQLQACRQSMEEQCRVSNMEACQEKASLQVASLFHAPSIHPFILPYMHASIRASV